MLSMEDAAREIGVSVRTVQRAAKKGEIPVVVTVRGWRIRRDDLDKIPRRERGRPFKRED